jgi:hypothetical protein
MKDASALYGLQTRQLVETFLADGTTRGLVVLRHSVRHYDTDNPINEPFMGLTDEGKLLSYQWGNSLPPKKRLNFFSSFIGRCIETAYLMDKGHVAAGGVTSNNRIEPTLSPFYVRDPLRLFEEYLKKQNFLTGWFNRAIPPDVITPPEQVATVMLDFWKKRLSDDRISDQIDVCITHDWNLYVLRWYLLGVFPEAQENVDYLDGLIVFRDGSSDYVAAPGYDPRVLRYSLSV